MYQDCNLCPEPFYSVPQIIKVLPGDHLLPLAQILSAVLLQQVRGGHVYWLSLWDTKHLSCQPSLQTYRRHPEFLCEQYWQMFPLGIVNWGERLPNYIFRNNYGIVIAFLQISSITLNPIMNNSCPCCPTSTSIVSSSESPASLNVTSIQSSKGMSVQRTQSKNGCRINNLLFKLKLARRASR